MTPRPSPRLERAKARWREIEAEFDRLSGLAYRAAVDAGSRGADHARLTPLYDRLLLDLAPWRQALRRLVFRWGYERSEWLPASPPSAAYRRISRFHADLRALLPAAPREPGEEA